MLMRIVLVLLAPLLLTGCLLTPGKFTSDMVIQNNGDFSFSYKGEIFILGFSSLMQMGAAMDGDGFKAECYDEETFETRDCTEWETQEQRETWDANKAEREKSDKEGEAMMKALLGGIDPSSPEAIDELIGRMKRQKGWNSIVHKGDGVFEVDYSINGRLDRDFTFPVIEKMGGVQPFIVATARADGSVRVDAPGFAMQDSAAGMGALGGLGSLAGLAAMGKMSEAEKAGEEGATDESSGTGDNAGGMSQIPDFPTPEGMFTIRTNAEILTNNTDEGPSVDGGYRVLSWKISPRSKAGPETLFRLGE